MSLPAEFLGSYNGRLKTRSPLRSSLPWAALKVVRCLLDPSSDFRLHRKGYVDTAMEVKLYEHKGEPYLLAKSGGRQAKEITMRRKRLARLLRKLRAMRKSLPKRAPLPLRIGAAKKEAGRAFGFVKVQTPPSDQAVTHATFSFDVDKAKLKAALQRDGHYLLRSNLTGEDPTPPRIKASQVPSK